MTRSPETGRAPVDDMPGDDVAWREISFVVAREAADAWSDALVDAGAASAQVEDADAESPDEDPVFGEPGMAPTAIGWRRSRISALVPSDHEASALLAAAARALGADLPADRVVRPVAERDWVAETQAQFTPIDVGARLRIAPSWHAGQAPGRIEIVLDPGMAFGTGTHPTTRMCLEWLARALPAGARVIDYGCGSGLLAIAAARLGAADVVAIDVDPHALSATRDNAAANAVAIEVRAAQDPPPAPAQVVVANILASPLQVLAPLLEQLTLPGGTLVLAGLLERQVDEVSDAYRETEFAVDQRLDGWACLVGRKRA